MYVHFDSFSAGIHGIRQIVQADVLPPVVRLYDSVETQRNFGADTPDGRCGLILVFEGSAERVAVDLQAATKILDSVEATVANPDVAQNWFDNKSHAPSAAPFLEKDIVVDTIEVAAPWSRIEEVYDRVIDAVDAIPEVLAVSGHSSHSYRTGTNIYFSFGVRCDDSADLESAYDEVWQATMRATLAAGGGISHHHGIGRVRRPYLRAELGEAGHRMLTDIKHVLDPEGLFNPGVLI